MVPCMLVYLSSGQGEEGLLWARVVAPWAVAVACVQAMLKGGGGRLYTGYVEVNQPRIIIGEPN